jgi:hypothetical protein
LNGSSGPALIAMNDCPNSVSSTVVTDPAGPLGESAAIGVTRSIRQSGNSDV